MVVDDSRVMRVSAQKLLGKEFDVVVADDGEQAWFMVNKDPEIRMVFSDLSMPNLDGYGLLARFRESEDERLREMPIIIVTGGEDSDEAREEALGQGATDFIIKPFNSVDLKARARSHTCTVYKTRELKREAAFLQQKSAIDPLTGVSNREHFLERLTQGRAFTIRHKQPLSLVSIEVDGFNRFFLKRGRALADALIKQIADILRQHVREEDTVARTGLSRFSILMSSTEMPGARLLAERVCDEISETGFVFEEERIQQTLSGSVIVYQGDEDLQIDDLMSESLQLLREAQLDEGGRILDNVAVEEVAVTAAAHEPVTSIDQALDMIARGHGAELVQDVGALMEKLSPLLALAEEAGVLSSRP